jgi:hypothetical protein
MATVREYGDMLVLTSAGKTNCAIADEHGSQDCQVTLPVLMQTRKSVPRHPFRSTKGRDTDVSGRLRLDTRNPIVSTLPKDHP